MENINFSADYPKLAGQTTAVLKKIVPFKLDKEARETYKDLLERDTLMSNGDHYPLRDGKYIIMYFEGNLGVEFTTIRYAHAYYGNKAFDRETWANERIGKEFQININIKPQDVINAVDSIAKPIVHYKKPKAPQPYMAKKILIKKSADGTMTKVQIPIKKTVNKKIVKTNNPFNKPYNKFKKPYNNQRQFDGRNQQRQFDGRTSTPEHKSPFKESKAEGFNPFPFNN